MGKSASPTWVKNGHIMGFPISGPHREKIGSISRDPCNFHLFISNIFMQTRQKILSSLFSKGLYSFYVMNFDMIDDSVPILDIFVHVYIVFVYEYVFPFEFVFSICAFLTFYSTGIPFQIYLYLYIVLYSYLHFCLVFSICVFLTFHRDPTQRGFAHSTLSSLFWNLQSTTVFVFAFVFVFVFVFVSISIFVYHV